MTKELIYRAVSRFTEEAKNVYGNKLKQVILFGSCARGDYENDSDMDIMVLLDVPKDMIISETDKVFPIVHRLDEEFDYELLFAPIVQSVVVIDVLPFYKNVEKEGVKFA